MLKSTICAAALAAIATTAGAVPVTFVYEDTLAEGVGNLRAGDEVEYRFTFEDGGLGVAERGFDVGDLVGASLRIASIVRLTIDVAAPPLGAWIESARLATDASGAVTTFDFAMGRTTVPGGLASINPALWLPGGDAGASDDGPAPGPACDSPFGCEIDVFRPIYETTFAVTEGSTAVFSHRYVGGAIFASAFTGPSMTGSASVASAPTGASFARVSPVPLPAAGLLLLAGLGALAARRRPS